MKRYPRQLSTGANNIVIALNEKEVAKIYEGDTRSDIGSESEKMKFANEANNLVARFIRIDFDPEKQWEMLVMERLYPMDYRSVEFEKRELIFSVFEDEYTKPVESRSTGPPSFRPGFSGRPNTPGRAIKNARPFNRHYGFNSSSKFILNPIR